LVSGSSGPPCGTIRRILAEIDGDEPDRAVGAWAAGHRARISGVPPRAFAVDGKIVRGAGGAHGCGKSLAQMIPPTRHKIRQHRCRNHSFE
jgi:hypothetical protein